MASERCSTESHIVLPKLDKPSRSLNGVIHRCIISDVVVRRRGKLYNYVSVCRLRAVWAPPYLAGYKAIDSTLA